MSGKDDVRDALHKQQGGKCMYCGRKLPKDIFHIDHKTPRKRNGSDRLSNLQLLCGTCNGRKGGDLTDGEFRRRYKLEPARGAEPPLKAIPKSYFDNITKQGQARKAKQRRQQEREPVKGPRQAAQEEARRINEKAEAEALKATERAERGPVEEPELPLFDLGGSSKGKRRAKEAEALHPADSLPSAEPIELAPTKFAQVIGKWDGTRYYEVNLLTGKKRSAKKKPDKVTSKNEWVAVVTGEFAPVDGLHVQAGGDMLRVSGNGKYVDIDRGFGKGTYASPLRSRNRSGAPKTRRGLHG